MHCALQNPHYVTPYVWQPRWSILIDFPQQYNEVIDDSVVFMIHH